MGIFNRIRSTLKRDLLNGVLLPRKNRDQFFPEDYITDMNYLDGKLGDFISVLLETTPCLLRDSGKMEVRDGRLHVLGVEGFVEHRRDGDGGILRAIKVAPYEFDASELADGWYFITFKYDETDADFRDKIYESNASYAWSTRDGFRVEYTTEEPNMRDSSILAIGRFRVDDKEVVEVGLESDYRSKEISLSQKIGFPTDFISEEMLAKAVRDKISDSSADNKIELHDNNLEAHTKQFRDIINKIPREASESNLLADRAFVNSSIQNMAATFIAPSPYGGVFNSFQELLNGSGYAWYHLGNDNVLDADKVNHTDYAIFVWNEYEDWDLPDGANYGETWRAIYMKEEGQDYGHWGAAFMINNSGFTQEQEEALNSGINSHTAGLINSHANAISSLQSSRVRYDNANQGLTSTQQDNARTNIGALSNAAGAVSTNNIAFGAVSDSKIPNNAQIDSNKINFTNKNIDLGNGNLNANLLETDTLNAKDLRLQDSITNRPAVWDVNGNLVGTNTNLGGNVTNEQLAHLSGVNSNIQNQIDAIRNRRIGLDGFFYAPLPVINPSHGARLELEGYVRSLRAERWGNVAERVLVEGVLYIAIKFNSLQNANTVLFTMPNAHRPTVDNATLTNEVMELWRETNSGQAPTPSTPLTSSPFRFAANGNVTSNQGLRGNIHVILTFSFVAGN